MANGRLGLGEIMTDKLIKKACSMAMKAHEFKRKPYLVKKSHSLSNIVIFSFPGWWSVNDWFTGNAYGEKEIDLAQFSSLKRISSGEVATLNEAFLSRFQAILPKIQQELGKFVRERKQIVFTGHSSGGPIAILVTVWFLQEQLKEPNPNNTLPPLCMTFGSPLVGDHIFNHALSRENWSQYFTHFVMRYDIVPRVLLVPLSSIKQELGSILHFLKPRFTLLKQEPSREASTLYETVMRSVSSLASHAACHLMGNTYNLSETLSTFIGLSPFRPFGTYVFCTGNGELLVVENPDAVLQILFYSSQLCSAQEVAEISMRSIKDHQIYQREMQSLEKKEVIHLESLEVLPLSSDGNDVTSGTIDMFLNNLGLSTRARLCLRAAREIEKQKLRNQEELDAKKMTTKTRIDWLENYKFRCVYRKVSYYDAFKILTSRDDFDANMKRLELADTFDELTEMIEKYELPDGFGGISEWIDIGTRYIHIVEPLDIANYYRHLKNADAGSYMIKGRPKRYRFTQKWLEYAGRMETGSNFQSLFWAEVEELDLCLRTSKEGLSDDVKGRISLLLKNVEAWVSCGELGPDVFFEDSTFFKWWQKLNQQFHEESCISRMINSCHQVIKYDVFLSFRGEDTQNNFTSHLHAALSRAKIETFIDDDEFIRGDEFSSLVLNAIEESMISVIIFSKKYATSKWCLDELVKILKCKKKYGQVVIPVYYHVDLLEVRDQTGSFAELAKDFNQNPKMLHRWRAALREAANLFGFDSSNDNRCEATLVEEIVKHILKKLNDMYPSDNKDLVGVRSSVEKIESMLCIGSKNVCSIGIWGMDGTGKTTIAMAVFNEIKCQFENSYFALNVGENLDGLTRLRQEILSTILRDQHCSMGFAFMKQRLGSKRVLIVFDDVTSSEQIKFLIGDLNYLGLGSRVIIITRDMHVLKDCGVDDDNMYRIEALSHHEALQLFSWYAFEQNRPLLVYNELSNKIVKFAKGVPLALKVLGSFLRGRIKKVWESAIDKLESGPHSDIQEVLKVCYDGLDDDEKNIFLDIACFLKQEDKDFVIKFLDVSGFFAEIGISVLIDKCFITLSKNKITMHGLHQKMGWEIVNKESSEDIGRRSRLWHPDEILHVLKYNMGSEAIQGICLDMSQNLDIHLSPHAFAEMRNLRFLKVFNSIREENTINFMHDSSQGLELDFNGLRYLCWHGWPLKSLPSNCYLGNLVAIDMPHSNVEQLWIGVQDLFHLERINLSHSKHLHKIPDLSHAPNLESLILEGCVSLSGICSSIQYLNSLAILNLSNCRSLHSLPVISRNVEELLLDETAIEELPIKNLSRLVTLDLNNCSRLRSLPSSISKLKSLECLNLSGCSNLDGLAYNLANLEALKVLKAERVAIEVLSSIVHLCFLMELNLTDCRIVELPSSLGHLSSLESLLLGRNNFESIPSSIIDLSKLIYFDLGYCKKLRSLPEFPRQLQYIAAHGCTSLEALSGLVISTNARANFINCVKLDQKTMITVLKEFLQKIQERMMEFCPRPSAYICLPGTEIPEWFSYKSKGSCINFKLGSGGSNTKLVSFALSAIVELRNYHDDGQGLVVGCDYKIWDRDVKVVLYYGILPDNVDLDHIFLGYDLHMCSFDIDDCQCNADEVSVKFYVEDSNAKHTDCCEVKSCGVHLLYHQGIGNTGSEIQDVIDYETETDNDKETEIATVDKKDEEAVTNTDDDKETKIKEPEAGTDTDDKRLSPLLPLSHLLGHTSPPPAGCIDTLWRQPLQQKSDAKNDSKKKAGKRAKDKKWISQFVNMGDVRLLEEFSLKVLCKATKNFAEDQMIGRGGFGRMYRGTLYDGRQCAIKRVKVSNTSAGVDINRRQTFLNELESLSRVLHKNIVRLLGFCEGRNDFVLVYEYMVNGTLYDHLHTLESSPLNSWPERIKVALHVARGIEYLHKYAVPHIIHRDIKPSNILLDDTWTAKVSDFKLSVPVPGDDWSHVSTTVAGTVGYIDPEYSMGGRLTTESDVYSFGIVLLELLSGRKPSDLLDDKYGRSSSLVEFVVPYLAEDKIHGVLDPKVPPPTSDELEALASVAYLAFDCVTVSVRDRPSMTKVVSKLQMALNACLEHPSLSTSTSKRERRKEIAASSRDDDKIEETSTDTDDDKETEIGRGDKKEIVTDEEGEAVTGTDDDKEMKSVISDKNEEMEAATDTNNFKLLLSPRLAHTSPRWTGCIDTLWHQILQQKGGAKRDGERKGGKKGKRWISQLASSCFAVQQKEGGKNDAKKNADAGAKGKKWINQLADMGNVGHLEIFSLKVLREATNNFSEDHMIGGGGFGTVYRAILNDGRQVAVKRADGSNVDVLGREFLNELQSLSRVNHKNLVRLLGFCEGRNDFVLVYEYAVNGTLYDHLHTPESSPLNTWPARIKVALHVARGIEYLHEYAVPHIIHRDIKPSNILLDDTWTAKVSAFGLSVTVAGDDWSHVSTTVAGTLGYIDPECFMWGKVTAGSDVYSFGIVLLELLFGRKPSDLFDDEYGMLSSMVEFMDPKVPPPALYEIDALASVAYLAADCVTVSVRDRPSMTEVVSKLQIALNACSEPSYFAADWVTVSVQDRPSMTEAVNKLRTALKPPSPLRFTSFAGSSRDDDKIEETLTDTDDDKEMEIGTDDKKEIVTDEKGEAVTGTDDDKEMKSVTSDKIEEMEAATDTNDFTLLLSTLLAHTSPRRTGCIDMLWHQILQQKGGAKRDGERKGGKKGKRWISQLASSCFVVQQKEGGKNDAKKNADAGAKGKKWINQLADMGNVGHLEIFSLKVLREATNNFSEDHMIGGGGFGTVYRAILNDGRQVAVKRADGSNVDVLGREFLNELQSLSRVNHKNLVRLLGFCEGRNDFVLVYEYAVNGTLYDHLHTTESSPLNTWPARIKVALHMARGIEYLHEYAVPHIIHRDIKPSNILLDDTWTAKVSAFGLSVTVAGDDWSHVSTTVAGTVGYVDPECFMCGKVTAGSDVYSFGIVLLELLSGRKPSDLFDDEYGMPSSLVKFVVPYVAQDKIHGVLDPKVPPTTSDEFEALASVAHLAADCVAESGRDRPSMTQIVSRLQIALKTCLEPPSLSQVPPQEDRGKEIAASSPDSINLEIG